VGGRGSSVVCLLNASCFKFGSGGGKGDMEIDVTLAECAWYTRSDCRRGNDRTCLARSACGLRGAGVVDLRRFRCAFRLSRHTVSP
jgi:hypothetical protein